MRSIKVRIYPNRHQENIINQSFGCVRLIYNKALALKKSRYENHKENISTLEISKMITFWKKTDEMSFLKKANAQSLQQALRHLDLAYRKFFKDKKGFPTFKKRSDNQSYSVVGNVKIEDNKIKFPKLGLLKMKGLREFSGEIKTATLSRNKAGQYFISFCINDIFKVNKTKNISSSVGVDVGIKSMAVCSNGDTFISPNTLKEIENKLKFYQRKLANSVKGSRKFKTWKLKIAILWNRITNIKKDFLHKLSNNLVKNHDLIIVEDLRIANMLKNHKLAKAISNMSWGEFFRQLEYKCDLYGKNFVKVDARQTSQKCSNCGFVNKELTLSDRIWKCPSCHEELDRDLNAALNIKNKGLDKILKSCGDILIRGVCEARIPCL